MIRNQTSIQGRWIRNVFVFVFATGFVCTSIAALLADEGERVSKHERWVTSLAFSADGSTLVTGGGQSLQYRPGDVKIWDVVSGSLVKTLGTVRRDDKGDTQGKGHTSNVWSVAFSPDNKTLVTSGYDGKVIVWNVAEGTPIATLEKHKSWCRSVAFHPAGKHFATAGEDGKVVIWELDGAKESKEIAAHESAVYQVAFSPDGNTLATASTDKTAKLWDWKNAKELAKLEGHDDAVWSIAFSSDGERIATASADRKIKLWDKSGKELATLPGHTDWISLVTFSSDGGTLASSSLDRTIKIWNVELAMKLADEVSQTLAKLRDNKDASQKASDELSAAQTESDAATKKSEAITAVIDARVLPEELKQAEAALATAKENRFLKKAAEEAKAASDAATKAADEKTKEFAADKDFSAKLKMVKEGSLEDANKEKVAAEKAATDAAAKIKGIEEKKAAADKAITDAKAKSGELAGQLAKTLTGFNSTVWSVAFSPDGNLIAAGSHKDSLRIWNTQDLKELFPKPEKSADK